MQTEQQIQEEEVYRENVDRSQDDNAIFIEYEPEKATEKLCNIQSLPQAERLQYTNHLTELLVIIGPDITAKMSKIIKTISEDPEDDIKRALLQQIPSIIEYLQEYEDGYELIKDITQNTILEMLNNSQLEIKQEAGKRLSEIGQILNEQDRGNIILTKVLNMAHDDANEENRIVAVGLFSTLAQCFGRDLCEQFVGFEFLSLGEDPQIRVRKESITNLPTISKVVSNKFFSQKLLPFFMEKRKEHIWGMRKACVDVIVSMAEIAEKPQREKELTQMLLEYLNDQNRWVKVAAYKQLGPFIVVNQGGALNEELFKHYLLMSEHQINYLSQDNELLAICSQYFPAVLTVYGFQRWKDLQKILVNLIKSKHKKVRKPIACSLHEIAKIIGQERAEKDLFHIYEKGLQKDAYEDVKLAAIKNYSEFLRVFDKDKQENLLEVLVTVQGDQHKWRIREMIAQQIDKLTEIYSQDTIFQYIMPITMKLCNDIVSSVRQIAAQKAFSLVQSLVSHEIYGQCVIETIKGFCLSQRFNQRQTFVFMCFNLMNDPKLFHEHFLTSFQSLIHDKVVNVRIAIAECLSHQYKQKKQIIEEDFFKQLDIQVRQDTCNDIKKIFQDLDQLMNAEKLQDEKNQKKKKYVKKDNSDSPSKRLLIKSDSLTENKNSSKTSESNSEPIIQLEKIQPEPVQSNQQEQIQQVEQPQEQNPPQQNQEEKKLEESNQGIDQNTQQTLEVEQPEEKQTQIQDESQQQQQQVQAEETEIVQKQNESQNEQIQDEQFSEQSDQQSSQQPDQQSSQQPDQQSSQQPDQQIVQEQEQKNDTDQQQPSEKNQDNIDAEKIVTE